MFILSPVPKIVPWQYRPFFWLFSDKKEEATNKNINKYCLEKKPSPGFLASSRPIDAILAGVIAISGIGLITSFIKENKLWGYVTGALAALGAIAFGWFKYHATDYSVDIEKLTAEKVAQREAEKSQDVPKVKIDRQATTTTSTDTEIPLNLVRFPDEQVNENEYHIKVSEGSIRIFTVKDDDRNIPVFGDFTITDRSTLDIYKNILEKETLPKANTELLKTLVSPEDKDKSRSELIKIATEKWQPETIKVSNLPNRAYKACIEEHTIDILVPEFYINARPKATEEMLNALELFLGRLPKNLAKLVKQIKFEAAISSGEISNSVFRLAKMGFLDGVIDMNANPKSGVISIFQWAFSGPLQDLDEREKQIIASFNRFGHEVGHLLSHYINKNKDTLTIPILSGNNLLINNDFAGNNWDSKTDTWVKITNMDGNKPSEYAETYPNEDFAESVSGYLKDQNRFKELCPHRWAFLNAIVPQIKPSQS